MEGEEEKENNARKRGLAKKEKVMEIRKGGFGRRYASPFPLSCMIHHHLSYDQTDVGHLLIYSL